MRLDSDTLLVSTGTAVALLGFVMLYFWYRDRRAAWLAWWSLPMIAGGVAAFPITGNDWQNDFIVAGVGSAVRVGIMSAMWQGARVFGGRKPLWTAIFVPPAILVGLCLIPAFMQSMTARVVVVSIAQGAFCALAAYELWRGRAEELPSRRMTILIFLSFAMLMAVRVAGVRLMPFPMGALPMESAWLGGFALAMFVHAVFLGLLFIALTKERLELQQRNITLIDPLTGLLNRRALTAQIERKSRHLGHGPQQNALLVLDLDHFKSVNDRYGHDIGDQVLAAFSAVAEAQTRPADRLYRLGGEEFCILLPDTDVREALAVAEGIRRAFATSIVETERGERVSATLSIGIAATKFAGFDLELLLAAADAALYEAKARGRNRIVVADTEALRRSSAAPPQPDRRRA